MKNTFVEKFFQENLTGDHRRVQFTVILFFKVLYNKRMQVFLVPCRGLFVDIDCSADLVLFMKGVSLPQHLHPFGEFRIQSVSIFP